MHGVRRTALLFGEDRDGLVLLLCWAGRRVFGEMMAAEAQSDSGSGNTKVCLFGKGKVYGMVREYEMYESYEGKVRKMHRDV